MRTPPLKLPEDLDRRLTDLARRRKISRSALLREAIETYASEHEGSVTARAGELVGSLEGPKDLASDPRHLKGYGT